MYNARLSHSFFPNIYDDDIFVRSDSVFRAEFDRTWSLHIRTWIWLVNETLNICYLILKMQVASLYAYS